MNHSKAVLSLAAVALLITGAVLQAGPLTPPVGPVTSTFKTLTEVEPRFAINAANTPGSATALFRITQPGSYYLTGNITGVVGKHGIEIAASGVTVDLNGFDVVGVPAMGAFDGVVTFAGLGNIAVVNGCIRNWGDKGVDFSNGSINCRVAHVLVSGNTSDGISIGNASTVMNCSAHDNDGSGISAPLFGGSILNCTAYLNTVHGITIGSGCSVSGCTVNLNTANGINAANGCTISNCTAYDNNGHGINTSNGCTVADCTVRNNTLNGITCSSQCVIRDNACSINGSLAGDGAGIHATGSDNRIEGNNCVGADRGIDVDSVGNVIIRNTCSGNSINNWDVAAGNIILVVNATAAGAVTGNSGGVAPGSADPNANFTY